MGGRRAQKPGQTLSKVLAGGTSVATKGRQKKDKDSGVERVVEREREKGSGRNEARAW